MTKRHWNRQGQSTAEYAIIIALVLGAVIGMQTFVRRALNARIADASDNVLPDTRLLGINADGSPGNVASNVGNQTFQFEPDYTTSDFNTTTNVGSAANPDVASNTTLTGDLTTGVSTVAGDYGTRTFRTGTQTERGAP
jgi:hypothetical protein